MKNINYQSIQTFCRSQTALKIAFFWGLAEAMIFFIVPDFFFMFITLFAPFRGFVLALVTIAGSLVGGFMMHQLALINPELMNTILIQIPLISQKMVSQVHADLTDLGLKALFWAPLKGIPYKIFAVEAANVKISLWQFLLITIPGRLERLVITAGFAALVGKIFKKHLSKNPKTFLVLYLTCWFIFYILYAHNITKNY